MTMAKSIYKVSHAMRDAVKFRLKRISNNTPVVDSNATELTISSHEIASAKRESKFQLPEVDRDNDLSIVPTISEYMCKFIYRTI
jgi:hypothetical protein